MAQQHEISSMLSTNKEMATHKVISNSNVKFSTDMPNTTSTQDLYKIIQTWKQEKVQIQMSPVEGQKNHHRFIQTREKLYHITWLTFCHAQNTVKLFMLVFTFSHIFGLRGLTRLFRIYQWWNANYFLCYDWLLMITWSRFHLIWNSVVGFGIFPANSLVCVTTTNVRFLDGVHVLLCGNSS